MTTIEVEVIATETIQPSSPTPPHLKTFSLSALDQFAPVFHSAFFLCYTTTTQDKHDQKQKWVHHLKQSLAATLTHLYPLAGRISDNKHITCTDEGINFFEAHVHGNNLSQFLFHPQTDHLEKLLPKDHLLELESKALLSVQANFFNCGGMVIALLISHKLADAFSVSLFLNLWASIARGDEVIHPPKLDTTHTFPPSNIPSLVPAVDEKMVTKRFVFNAINIAALKTNLFTNPTSRAVAVTALIWRCAMNSAKTPAISSVARLPVNLRQKKRLPHLSQTSFGNCYVLATTTQTEENHLQLHDLVDKLVESVRRVESDYVKQLKLGDLIFSQPFQQVNELCSKGELERYWFSIFCNFPFYETDFGWGKPIWVTTTAGVGHSNAIVLMDTNCGTGVEAWVTLDEQDMVRFEQHPDLIAYTSA